MECAWRKKCSVKCEKNFWSLRARALSWRSSFHKQVCALAQTLQVMEGCRHWKWKILIAFLKIKTANISPATRDWRTSTACSATVPCTVWSTAPGIPGISRRTADGSRTAQAAPSRMIRSIMIRSCRSCGRRNTFFWKINTYFAHFSNNFTNLIFFSHLLLLNIYLCYNLITNIF